MFGRSQGHGSQADVTSLISSGPRGRSPRENFERFNPPYKRFLRENLTFRTPLEPPRRSGLSRRAFGRHMVIHECLKWRDHGTGPGGAHLAPTTKWAWRSGADGSTTACTACYGVHIAAHASCSSTSPTSVVMVTAVHGHEKRDSRASWPAMQAHTSDGLSFDSALFVLHFAKCDGHKCRQPRVSRLELASSHQCMREK